MKITTKTVFEIEFENNTEGKEFFNKFKNILYKDSLLIEKTGSNNIQVICLTKDSEIIWDVIEDFFECSVISR